MCPAGITTCAVLPQDPTAIAGWEVEGTSPLKGPQGSPKTRLGTGKGHSIPKVLALREGEERLRQPRSMLLVQEQREERDSQGQREHCQNSQ